MIVWRLGAKIVRTVLCCIVYGSCAQSYTHTHTHTCEQFLNLQVGLGLDFVFVCLFNLVFLRFFVLYSCVAFVVLGIVSSVLSQEIGWEERLLNYLFCVEWSVKP